MLAASRFGSLVVGLNLLALGCSSGEPSGPSLPSEPGADAASDVPTDRDFDSGTDVVDAAPSDVVDASVSDVMPDTTVPDVADVVEVGMDSGDASDGGALGDPLIIPLGSVPVGQPIPVQLLDPILGFHVVASSPSGGSVGIQRIASPSGEAVADQYGLIGFDYGALYISLYADTAASVPQNALTSAMPPELGEWKITFGSLGGASEVEARVYVQEGDQGAFHGGFVDLQVYIPDGLTISDPEPPHTVTPATAPQDACIAARLDSFYSELQALFGLGRGEVTFHPADASLVEITSMDEAYLDAFANTSGDGPLVNVILTERLDVYGTEVWGMAAGAPGVQMESGSTMSGIVLSLGGFPAAADGQTLVHELGHYAGLFHTSQGGSGIPLAYDPLTDTPECPNPMALSACSDAHNIMFFGFWGASGGGQNLVATTQQQAVVHGGVFYRPFLQGGTPPSPTAPPGTFQQDVKRGVGWPIRLSGKPLETVEKQLAAGLCGHAPRPRLESSSAQPEWQSELRRVAIDPDIAPMIQRIAKDLLNDATHGHQRCD